MPLYRQLWLALILSTLVALAGSLLASTLSARAYLQEQLRMKNADNASTLALSLSSRRVDAVEMELAVAALFDRGHYESIRILGPTGQVLVERAASAAGSEAPGWFMQALPIRAQPGEALITDGWKQVGKVTLVSHSRFAYRELWTSTVRMAGALLFAGLLGAWLGTLILRRLKRPLDAVIDQARAISERRFVTMPEPQVPELRQLSAAMNSTVVRLKAMFEEEAARLEGVRRESNFDALTGLANRAYFMARLRAALEGEEARSGSLLLLRVARLAEINSTQGREKTDDLLKAVGQALDAFAQRQSDALAGRLNGADFGLLLTGGDARGSAAELLQAVQHASARVIGEAPAVFIGVAGFAPGADFSVLLTGADSAVAAAEADGISAVRAADLPAMAEPPRSTEQWAQMIRLALEQRWVRLVSFPVADFGGAVLHRECPLRLMFSADGEWMPAGHFLPMAERLGLTPMLDLAAVRLGLEELKARPAMSGLAVNLAASSIQDNGFRQQLGALLRAEPAAAERLWLEVSENGALTHLDAFRAFCAELAGTGCRLGLEHFGRQFSQIGKLHDLGLHYLKVDASFVRGVEGNAGNQAFLKGLTGIAHNIGLLVLAEGVVSDAELQALGALGFDGATGPAVKDA